MSSTDADTDAAQTRPAGLSSSGRRFGDSLFSALSVGSGLLIFVTLAAVAIFLTTESMPAVVASQEFTGTAEFSLVEYALPLVYGTVLAAAIALLIAIPVAVGIALFISHYAPRRMAAGLGYMIDLLAAVPSVVYGLWGGVWLVPKLEPLYVFLNTYFGWIPLFAGDPTAPMRNLASASVVLAVMVLPIITAVSREVFLQTPRLQEEAALALGATRWETIRTVVLPFGRGGVVAASMLGLGRALGETMAVLMILAPGATFSLHILEVGRHNSIAASIASRQAEASGVDMSLLIFTGLVLFVLTFIINAIARWIVARSGPKS
ncbi:phosphate ABC transporter permease subunit PstC [Brachybacterium saurashtrense]|uniref:Phosphate transport system permease protein n=1 Tax=Brachybacterium saurashtrense TaxID=556288 RepID=A0A345YQ09_9MICO|nr:phosphate ABC transporter permease subunit PstC [Brachybacterium saurashtrense]AXK46011.1 phosphate ABC transporter permease subunit PstC [Brachybacterium saurashtrense]RRR23750.1 phosphate ABC transporter permease subunit PstC [Brachybacterium saurashtrense]